MANKIILIGYVPGVNGISTHINNIYRHLDRNRYDYLFLIPENHRDEEEDLNALKEFGAQYAFLDYSKNKFSEKGRRQLKRLMTETPGICGVHVHDTDRNTYPLVLADSIGLPVKIIQYHSGANRQMLNQIENHPEERKNLCSISEDRFCRLACSDLSGKYAYGNLPFDIFPNAVDCNRFYANPLYRSLTRKKLDIPEDAPTVGMAAFFNEHKNPLFAAEVFFRVHEIVPNAHMIVCGVGPLLHNLWEFFSDRKLLEYVHFTGEQPQMEFFYNAMDVFYVSSWMEGLPNTVIEAQATGLSCLVSDRVTEMVCITDLVKQLSLEHSMEIWVSETLRLFKEKRERRSYDEDLKKAGYEIGDAVKKLMQIYDDQRCLRMRSSTLWQ